MYIKVKKVLWSVNSFHIFPTKILLIHWLILVVEMDETRNGIRHDAGNLDVAKCYGRSSANAA